MPTKQELMNWMKEYKAKNCKPISRMRKNELFEEAKRHGYLYQKFGIVKKTKNKTTSATKPPARKTEVSMTRKEIFQKLKELNKKDMVNMTKSEAIKVAQKRKKLIQMLKNVQSA